MFNRLRKKTDPIDDQIMKLLSEMDTTEVTSDEFPQMLTYVERLTEVKKKTRKLPVSRDTLVTVGGSILSVIIIVTYEHHNVITSKALGQIIKPRPN